MSPISNLLKVVVFVFLLLFLLNYYFNFYIKSKVKDKKCEKLSGTNKILLNNLTTTTVMVSATERLQLDFEDLVVVSFTSMDHIAEAIRSCDSFQQHIQFMNTTFIMYFAEDVTADFKKLFATLCKVAILRTLDLKNYPKNVHDLQQYRFKAIYQALTLKEHKVVLNIDSSVRFDRHVNFKNLMKKAIKQNPTDVTLLSETSHSMFSTIHPTMYNCFPDITVSEMYKVKQYQSGIILWIGSENGWKVMKRFVECALQENCMAPPGSTKSCVQKNIYKFPDKFSGCHRFDQSAINLILYEKSKHSPSKYQWSHPGFLIEYL